ncbi:MAG TPA: SPOR domain-containing protein, partial [Wenzhouxiangella sp.]|nr:SPOR domain-containing protein [Wenzhouxiangella sp.]
TAPVEVRAITFGDGHGTSPRPASLPVYIQAGAFSEKARAKNLERELRRAGLKPVSISRARTRAGRLWRVRLGPVKNADKAISAVEQITRLGLGQPRYVYP